MFERGEYFETPDLIAQYSGRSAFERASDRHAKLAANYYNNYDHIKPDR